MFVIPLPSAIQNDLHINSQLHKLPQAKHRNDVLYVVLNAHKHTHYIVMSILRMKAKPYLENGCSERKEGIIDQSSNQAGN